MWKSGMIVAQVPVARPTDQLAGIEEFYGEGLGLEIVGSFKQHDGYDGIMFGLPNTAYHLEFTQHENGSPCPAPTEDILLVFYMPNHGEIKKIIERLARMGYEKVEPENPYWLERGVTIPDPDGWRIVLMNTEGI